MIKTIEKKFKKLKKYIINEVNWISCELTKLGVSEIAHLQEQLPLFLEKILKRKK